MELNCVECFIVTLMLFANGIAAQDRNVQHFVKIDVSKVSQKLANDSMSTVAPDNDTSTVSTINSTTSPMTTLQEGSTKSTPTTSPSTTVKTTSQPKTTVEPTKENPFEAPREGRLVKKVPSGYYCKCDLKINICDVNCCCDIDCSNEILRTFDCSEERLDINEYHHGEGLQSCEVQGGLFCLVGEHPGEEDHSFYDSSKKELSLRHRWNEVFPISNTPKQKIPVSYRVNDLIQLYNETNERIEILALPYSITNTECQLKQKIRFLRDQSTSCRRSLEDLESFNTNFIEQQMSIRYLRTPKLEIMEHCLNDACFNSSIRYCNLAGQQCQTSNQTAVDALDGSWYCPEIRIMFVHNYTHLSDVEIRFLCGLLDTSGELYTVWQKISLNFLRKDEKKFSRKISGNLGYLPNKPLILSKLQIPENDTTEERRTKKYILDYFSNGTREPDEIFQLKLPKSKRHRCVLDEETHYNVLFGENLWAKCDYRPQINFTSDSNFTKVCNDLQANLYNLLLHDIHPQIEPGNYESLNAYMSKYGNPVNRTAEWIHFRALNVVNERVAAIAITQSSPFFSCQNMLINVKYHFYHAKTTVRGVPRQQVLQEVEIVFGPRVDLRFSLDEEIRLPIYVQVQFFDLTSSGRWLVEASLWSVVVGLLIVYCII